MSDWIDLQAGADDEGERVDLFVGKKLDLSRAKVKGLFEAGGVLVDGRKATKGLRLKGGASVRVTRPSEAAALEPDPSIELAVLLDAPPLVAVDKPSGMPAHPLQPGELRTVANGLAARFPECIQASADPREGGLCHRLDVGTSGVLLAARDRGSWENVRRQFSERQVEKRYWALVSGPIADEGEIDLPLRHHARGDRVEPVVLPVGGAREAFSRFRVLSRSGELSFVEVQIETGVLHQIRAHLAAVGAPVVGDVLYGGRAEPGQSRFFLHAHLLGLRHPTSGDLVRIESPLPPDLGRILATHGMRLPSPTSRLPSV